jgi:hypothetical protein
MSHLSREKIFATEDEEIIEAFTPPSVPKRAMNIFTFLQTNRNLCTTMSGMTTVITGLEMGGMTTVITGLDRYKLVSLAKGYGIDLFRYMFAVDYYEQEMLRQQDEIMK